jgi:hypothetical protein
MNIGAVALTMKWVAKGRGKTPMQIAQISPSFAQHSATFDILQGGNLTWGEIMKGSVLTEKGLCFATNLSKDVFTFIAEAELMEQLGFPLEPTMRSVAVRKDRLHRDLEAVQKVIKEYNAIVDSLTTAEARFFNSYKSLLINSRIPSNGDRGSIPSLYLRDSGLVFLPRTQGSRSEISVVFPQLLRTVSVLGSRPSLEHSCTIVA